MFTPLLITGAIKTGTTTAVAICNAHPRIHVLYEVDFTAPAERGSNAKLVAEFPQLASLFSRSGSQLPGLVAVHDAVPQFRDQPFLFFGTKLPSVALDHLRNNTDIPVIFTVRDIRTWLCKNLVFKGLLNRDPNANAVPLAVNYGKTFLTSFLHARSLRLRMEDLVLDEGNRWPRQIAAFLGVQARDLENWWDKRSQIEQATSFYSTWGKGHHSAFMQPFRFDTESVISKHDFWNAYLPVFRKYFDNTGKDFTPDEVRADLLELEAIGRNFTMSLSEGFEDFRSVRMALISQDDKQYLVEGIVVTRTSLDTTKPK